MTRITGVSPDDAMPEIRAVFESVTRRFGRLLTPVSVTAHHPDIFRGYIAFEGGIGRANLVDARLKDLTSLKVASLVGCPFWLDIGSAVGRATGITEAQLRDLANYRGSAEFSDLERLVLDYAVAMTDARLEVSDALFSGLRGHFDDAQIIELTATIAWENYRARFNHALSIASQGLSDGLCSARPERPY